MKATRVILIGVTLAALMVPFAYGIWFIGPTNFIATNGGITTFAQNFQATSLTYAHGLNFFTQMVWGPRQQGNIGIDAAAGVNISVTAITRDQIRYTVTTAAPGPVNTYVYYYRNVNLNPLSEPTAVTVGGVPGAYTYAAGMVTVTSLGTPVNVVLDWTRVQSDSGQALDLLWQLFPVVAMVMGLELRRQNLIDNNALIYILVAAAVGVLVWMMRAAGF